MISKKPNDNLTFKFAEIEDGGLAADIDKIIKKRTTRKIKKP